MARKGTVIIRERLRSLAATAVETPVGALLPRLGVGRPAIAVLNYHRVHPELANDPHDLVVTPDRFRAQLQLVRARYPVLSLETALAALQRGTLPGRHAVCVTFDDGYRDNRTRALPILEDLRLPATLFITTGFVGRKDGFWWDRLDRASAPPNRPQSAAPPMSGGWVHREVKAVDPQARERWLESIDPPLPPFVDDDLQMTFDELRSLPEFLTIAAHGHEHVSLGLIGAAQADADLAACRQALQRELPGHAPLLAYPFGGEEDVNEDTVRLAQRYGFTAAFTTTEGVVRATSDPYRLPRVVVHDESPGRLLLRLFRLFASGCSP